jgi:hypothetical protein
MRTISLLGLSGVAAVLFAAMPANSQPIPQPGVAIASEAEMIGLHQLCDRGDRQACIRFGFMLGEARERRADWRRLHPDWWGWEHP